MLKVNIKKILNKEILLYLIFGITVTLLNIILFYLFINVFKMSIGLGNVLDNIICILFQYFTNRIWVFESENKGKEAIKEFIQFILARGITAIIDQIFVVVGIDFFVNRFISIQNRSVFSLLVKVISNIIVIVLNYIFSKHFIFT
ncbi:GtrA family protein [Leptotrichia sp. oral taxon 221]|jgi:cell wall teichoic acid glycosylation protein gtcA|uniref:GtrA family protein n=1 Tax=Leptotrichia sp. oral taxon 221 TaxID=712362 RepID=UPI001B8D59BA|nr:GtrA family protein [Leptotrichia sp. oral taxon 221]QUB97146.1 GtrA family protein [Leptotrichia sp. oral taxon 221]